MAVSKNKLNDFAERFKELFSEAAEEKLNEIRDFIENEVMPNSPGLAQFVGQLHYPGDEHPRYGINGHRLTCGRCKRGTPIAVPMGKFNALWNCPSCGISMHAVEDDFQKCPKCKSLMVREKVHKPDDSISMDYECKTCRANKEKQREVATTGGALVLCPTCHTVGTLPATDKQVIAFRKMKNIGPEVEVRFLLVDTQCPRCADEAVARTFTEAEQQRILLHSEDMEKGYAKAVSQPAVKKKKGGKKDAATKNTTKSSPMVGVDTFETDEIPAPTTGVFHRHPGSKVFH